MPARCVAIVLVGFGAALFLALGCEKKGNQAADPGKSNAPTTEKNSTPDAKPTQSAGGSDASAKNSSALPSKSTDRYDEKNNPTTKAGRGTPDLESADRPAAWALIDGMEGEFREENGAKLTQWYIPGPVSSTPTFRVEAYAPLLGDPHDFQCLLQSNKVEEGKTVFFAIRAKEGTFRTGQDYNLLNPGENFTVVNRQTGETVKDIPALIPGEYGLVCGVKNVEKDAAGAVIKSAEGLAVTYFTVSN